MPEAHPSVKSVPGVVIGGEGNKGGGEDQDLDRPRREIVKRRGEQGKKKKSLTHLT